MLLFCGNCYKVQGEHFQKQIINIFKDILETDHLLFIWNIMTRKLKNHLSKNIVKYF
jgi:hypothetical protein